MKSINTHYTTKENLQMFIKEHQIVDSYSLLIQIFSANSDELFVENMLEDFAYFFPNAIIVGATSDGAINNGKVENDSAVVSFTKFEKTVFKLEKYDNKDSNYGVRDFVKKLLVADTKLIIAFASDVSFNNDLFLKTINKLDKDVVVSGGVAGSKKGTQGSFIFTKDGIIKNGALGVSFSGDNLRIYTECGFNWQRMGKKLTITKAKGNRVYTIDNKKAVDVFTYYFGKESVKYISKIGIEFPLMTKRNGLDVARAVLSKESDGSLIFAGDLLEGDMVQFGFGNTKEILRKTFDIINATKKHPSEAIFVYSCMGRKQLMQDDIEIETLPLQQIAPTSGFFTHGEFYTADKKEFLNLTITLLSLSETDQIKDLDINPIEKMEFVNSPTNILAHFFKHIR